MDPKVKGTKTNGCQLTQGFYIIYLLKSLSVKYSKFDVLQVSSHYLRERQEQTLYSGGKQATEV